LLLCGSCVLWAQSQPVLKPAQSVNRSEVRAKVAPVPRLLDASDGLSILGAALESRDTVQGRSDCSHLVHTIYEKAGFPYKYQSSSDLYAGVDEFRRVTQPQPGDLVVWPGHAGVVVNPAQHTFYSALRSGFGVQPYDSVYWKGRGRPHFFRYVKAAPVFVAASRTASLKPAGLRRGNASEAPPPNTADETPDADDKAAGLVEPVPVVPALPTVVVLPSAHPKPDQVRAALTEQFRSTADALQSRDVLARNPAVVAFDRFEIQKLQMKGDKGWAQIRMGGVVALTGPGMHSKQPKDVQRWNLRRVPEGGWEMALPADAVYLPRDAAVRILAHQLAALTDAPADPKEKSQQKTQLSRWLNDLLEEPSSH
jgi:NlpC/P60 family